MRELFSIIDSNKQRRGKKNSLGSYIYLYGNSLGIMYVYLSAYGIFKLREVYLLVIHIDPANSTDVPSLRFYFIF